MIDLNHLRRLAQFGGLVEIRSEVVTALIERLEAAENRVAELEKWARGLEESLIAANDRAEAARERVTELENDEVRQRLANAEHQLYMKDLAIGNIKASRRDQWRRRKEAEAELARRDKEAGEPVGYEVVTHSGEVMTLCKVESGQSYINMNCTLREVFTAAPPAALPPAENEVISIAKRLVSRYIANNGGSSEFICCITPERSSIGTGGVWDDWKALDKALKSAGGSVSDE